MNRAVIIIIGMLWPFGIGLAGDSGNVTYAPAGGTKTVSHSDPVIERAVRSLQAASWLVQNDPTRPVYHFRPPAQWMNDPCGGLHHKGYYHLFYQLNPHGDRWATIHWGHARSKDLVYWEHLPPAIAPAVATPAVLPSTGKARL
jgi:hypothetical protein